MKTILDPATRTALLSAAAALSLSCSAYDCRGENESRAVLHKVPVPASWSPGGGEEASGPPGAVHRQSYSLEPDGEFTFHRSLETAVGHLGAELASLDRAAADALGVEPFGGVLVRAVEKKGPAAIAGLKADDVIVGFGGKPALSIDRLEYLIEERKPGEPVELEILRGGGKTSLTVTMGSEIRIESAKGIQQKLPALDDRPRTGLRLVELSDEARRVVLGPGSAEKGLLVVEVLPGGPAYFAGLLVRDYVTKVGDLPVTSLTDYSSATGALEPGSEAPFTVRREGAETLVEVEIDSNATAESGFHVPAVVDYQWRPSHRVFSLIMGFVFNYESCFSVRQKENRAESFSSRNWGAAVDLIKYEGDSRGKGRLKLLWLIPIWWGDD